MVKISRDVLNSKKMKSLEALYLKDMKSEIALGHELYVRNYLIANLLIVGGGQRPEAICHFRVQEFFDATPIKKEK